MLEDPESPIVLNISHESPRTKYKAKLFPNQLPLYSPQRAGSDGPLGGAP